MPIRQVGTWLFTPKRTNEPLHSCAKLDGVHTGQSASEAAYAAEDSISAGRR